MADSIELADATGTTHLYRVMGSDSLWSDDPGVFIFAQASRYGWTPLFIGACKSFRKDIPRHKRWKDAAKQGAATILIAVIPDTKERARHEQSMIALIDPPLNRPAEESTRKKARLSAS